ncbi:MAG: hypothetical protein F6K42_31920, partial [Leptolyngbya sp. SIO1D8]|nr:hypothetical protein [Leptolyngbya sp. SIO1D8]
MLTPDSTDGQRLWDMFGVYPWKFILKYDGERNWMTEGRYPLRPRLLWKHFQDAAVQIGVRFGNRTQYALLDIDRGSPYLTMSAITQLREALETIGIVRTIPIRSSWSD